MKKICPLERYYVLQSDHFLLKSPSPRGFLLLFVYRLRDTPFCPFCHQAWKRLPVNEQSLCQITRNTCLTSPSSKAPLLVSDRSASQKNTSPVSSCPPKSSFPSFCKIIPEGVWLKPARLTLICFSPHPQSTTRAW